MSRGEWTPAEAIGPYRLVERLAAGGMGEVWRAWDGRLKRPVAVKHILPHILDRPGVRERFRREAEAGARLTHPAVVQIYDLVESPEGDWLVMELVVGKTLRQLLSAGPLAGPLPIRSALQWGREIAGGLAAAHAEGILHRDLKAGNVMITAAGHAKILDFGIARAVSPPGTEQEAGQEMTLSQTGAVVGTSYAMSPEQILGLPLDCRSDLFSLGSLLYEMLTGEAPFRAASAAATLARVCNYRPLPARRLRAEIPAEVSALVERLLEKEPNARPRDAGEVVARLEEATTGMPAGMPAPRPPPADRAPGLPPDEATFIEGRPRAADFEESSATFPRGRRGFLHYAGVLAGGLLLALALAWQGGRLAAPPRPASTYELYEEGLAALRRYDKPGNLDEAIADFRQIVGRVPNHAAAHAALAHACQLKFVSQSKDRMWLDQALPLAEQAVALDGYLASARVSLGLVYTSLGRLDEATREIEKAIQLEPGNADAQYALGTLYESRTQLDLAVAAFQRAVTLRPDRQFYDALGALYLRTGRVAPAIAAFQSSIRLAPDGFAGYRNLGVAYYTQGDLAKAAAQFQKALEIQPQPSLYSNLGGLYFAQGLYPQAAQAYEQALELPGGANDYLFWGNLGDACRFLPEDSARAREAYSRALQLLADRLRATPRDSTLLSRRALYLAKRGDCGPALTAGGEIERLARKDGAAQFRLVVADEVCGRREPALAMLEKALRNGYPLAEAQRDPELLALRGDVRYHRLLVRLAPTSTAP